MGNVFAQLQQDMEDRHVLFLTFDVTTSVTKTQSRLLGDTLAINEALEGIETGNIVLIDRRGQ